MQVWVEAEQTIYVLACPQEYVSLNENWVTLRAHVTTGGYPGATWSSAVPSGGKDGDSWYRHIGNRIEFWFRQGGSWGKIGEWSESENLQSVTERGATSDRIISVRGSRNAELLGVPTVEPDPTDIVAGEHYFWFGATGSTTVPTGDALADLSDVNINAPTDHQVLTYDAASGKWINSTYAIDLTGYATQSWVTAGFAPITHTHTIAQVTGLQSALDGKEPAFIKNTGFNKNFGTTAGTVAQGNDSRIVNGQTAFDWGNHALAGYAVRAADNTFTAHNHFTGALSIPQAAPTEPHAGQAYVWFGSPGSGSGGGGGEGTLAGLDDVTLSSLSNNQFLRYNSSTGKWVNSTFTVDLSSYIQHGTGSSQVRNNTQLDARYAPISHTHPISQVTGLQGALDGKEPAFTKNTAFNKNFGTTAGTVAQGNDSRIVNGQTAFGWGDYRQYGLGTQYGNRVVLSNIQHQVPAGLYATSTSTTGGPLSSLSGSILIMDSGVSTGGNSFLWLKANNQNNPQGYITHSSIDGVMRPWVELWTTGNLNPSDFGALAGANTWTGHNHFTGALSIPQAAPTGPHSGQAYVWFGSPGSGGGGGTSGTLAGLDDVALSSLANNQLIRYNSSTGKWVNFTANYAAASHTHPISQITGLQAALDGKEPAFAKNTAFNKNFGTTSGTVAQGNDSRIVNGQTAYSWGDFRTFGLGSNSGAGISPAAEWDVMRPTQFIRSTAAANSPFTSSGSALHISYNSARSAQLFFPAGGSGQNLQWRYTTGDNNYAAVRTIWDSANLANGTTSQYIRGNGSLATFPTIGTGTLSLSTGTGLSGSASFGANQTGNTSFTVSAASGYAIPTTAQIGNWNAAYGWGDYRQWGLASINALGSIAAFDGLGAANQFICASSGANTPFAALGTGIHMALASTRMAQLWFNTSAQTVQFRTNHSGWNDVHTFWTSQNIDPVPTSRQINTGNHLTGGGNLSANRTLSVAFNTNTWVVDSESNQRMYFGASGTNTQWIVRASRATGTFQFRNLANSTLVSIDVSSGKITCPVIEPAALIVPSAPPSNPEAGKRYVWFN